MATAQCCRTSVSPPSPSVSCIIPAQQQMFTSLLGTLSLAMSLNTTMINSAKDYERVLSASSSQLKSVDVTTRLSSDDKPVQLNREVLGTPCYTLFTHVTHEQVYLY